MKKYIKCEYGQYQLLGNLKKFLVECKCKYNTRYAINGIYVGDGVMASTDGHRLAEVKVEHKIKPDTYFCSKDGWLLRPIEGNFPRYEDIIPKKQASKLIVEANNSEGSKVIGKIFGGLYSAGWNFDYALMKKPIEILSEIINGKVKVYVSRKDTAHRPICIEAATEFGQVRYVQMPINLGE